MSHHEGHFSGNNYVVLFNDGPKGLEEFSMVAEAFYFGEYSGEIFSCLIYNIVLYLISEFLKIHIFSYRIYKIY